MTLNWSLHKKTDPISQKENIDPSINLLSDLETNSLAQIKGFAPSLSVKLKAHLQAYGIIPGNTLRVQQKKPVTVVQVEHTEIALETELAKSIYVEIN
mgnify:CR=1 FL=1